jgi:hypothetical protein
MVFLGAEIERSSQSELVPEAKFRWERTEKIQRKQAVILAEEPIYTFPQGGNKGQLLRQSLSLTLERMGSILFLGG